FRRTDQGWQLDKPTVRVQGYLVDRVIDQVMKAKRDEKADISSDPKQLGLDNPRVVVTLTKKEDGKQWRLRLGNETPGGDQADVCVSSSDRTEPMPVLRRDLDTLTRGVNDFRSLDLLNVSTLNAQAVTLQPAGKDAVALEKTGDNKWK